MGIAAPRWVRDWQDHSGLREQLYLETAAKVGRCYRKTEEILVANREFLEGVTDAPVKKKVISMADILRIRARCRIVPAAL